MVEARYEPTFVKPAQPMSPKSTKSEKASTTAQPSVAPTATSVAQPVKAEAKVSETKGSSPAKGAKQESPQPSPTESGAAQAPAATEVKVASVKDATSIPVVQENSPAPNFYVVSILEGKDLKACDGSGPDATSDPYVRLNCTKNQSQSTKTQLQTLEPKWKQQFYFVMTPAESQILELIVEDSDMFTSDFMGRCLINLEVFKTRYAGTKQIFWIGLEDQPKAEDKDAFSDLSPTRNLDQGCGRICIAIETRFIDRKSATLEQGESDRSTVIPTSCGLCDNHGGACVEGHEKDAHDATHSKGSAANASGEIDLTEPETEADLKQQEDERKRKMAELSDIQFKSGEYQIQVRILEVRDLKPMDLNGLCDPVVCIECLGHSQYTSVKQKQLSCIFDETLFFNFRQLDKDTIEQANIKVSVIDADASNFGFSQGYGDELIGYFGVDIPYVYFRPGHKLKRKWVALVGSGKSNSDSIMGYLKLSIVVIGPGDKTKLLTDASDEEPEEVSIEARKDINSLVLVPPRVSQTLTYLVVSIHRAEDLPDMDKSMLGQGGIDGFARVYFSGQDILETKRVTVKGSELLTVEFNEELWFPVLVPTMSDNIFISLWDADMTTNELVANILRPFSFSQVQKFPGDYECRWTNLYGPPVGYVVNTSSCKRMQSQPAHASTYRGRLLVSLRVEDASKSNNDHPHARILSSPVVAPLTKSYSLRIALFYGTEIPAFATMTNWSRNTAMSVRISIGKHAVESSRAENVAGICQWNEYLELSDLELPTDTDQLPDVFVHLVRLQMNETRYVCFARYTAREIFDASRGDVTIPAPQWVTLTKDSVFNDLKDRDFTGNLLMNLQLQETPKEKPTSAVSDAAHLWRQHANQPVVYMKYTLFVHIYQGRCLPAADPNGLADPYVQVSCAGVEGKLAPHMATRDPCFYETIAMDIELPQKQDFLPKLSLQVYDKDQYHADDYVGGVKFSLAEFKPMTSTVYGQKLATGSFSAPRPKWYPICFEKEGDTEGELLLSFDLIQKDSPGAIVAPPPSIRPVTQDMFVEITCLGCRGLQPAGFVPLSKPFAKFEIGEISKANQPKFTNASSKPSAKNPNFLQRVLIPVKMPVDALFAPRLNVTVSDRLLGGYYTPILGVCSIDLGQKLPTSNGKPNPKFVERHDSSVGGSANPYVDRGIDLTSFPGTVPSNVMRSLSSFSQSDQGGLRRVEEEGEDSALSPTSHSKNEEEDDDDELSDEDDVPHYLVNRRNVSGALEDELDAAFETYSLFRGDMLLRRDGSREPNLNAYRSVGKFKGIVRVLRSRDEPPVFDLDAFLNPQTYLVRVYVLDAHGLIPKSASDKCEPYLRVTLGDGQRREHVADTRSSDIAATCVPKFHEMFQFKAELPGASELRVDVLDHDAFSLTSLTGASDDDLVGGTLIDLEDRWFSSKWQGMDSDRRPLETRPLFAPSSSLPRGNIRLWVDILTGSQIHAVKPIDISPPPVQRFEVRVVIYKVKNVVAGDFTSLSDLYVKSWVQDRDGEAQMTDTHWRAKRGRASFNWRMKFPIELPIDSEDEGERGHLHLQLWDKDVLYDDCLADTVLDLSAFLKQAYRRKQVVSVFAPHKKRLQTKSSSSMSARRLRQSGGGYSSVDLAGQDNDDRRPASGEHVIDIAQHEHESDVSSPLLQATPAVPDDKQQDESEDLEDAKSLVRSFLQRFGVEAEDPEDARWLTLTTRDDATGARVKAGDMLLSVEILPEKAAAARAAGLGRSEPNAFPYLSEPADRLHLAAMWNPLVVLEALLGPAYFRAFASFAMCALLVLLLLVAGPIINILVTLMVELSPSPAGWVGFFLLLGLAVAALAYCAYRCRRAVSRLAASAISGPPASGSSRATGRWWWPAKAAAGTAKRSA